jgi:hypothetical protein
MASGKNSIILAPLPRYLFSHCCVDTDHVAGLEFVDHREKMREEVDKA